MSRFYISLFFIIKVYPSLSFHMKARSVLSYVYFKVTHGAVYNNNTHSRIIYKSFQAPEPIGPYNQAVRIDDTLYLSGQIGLDPGTGEMVDGIEAQTVRALVNMQEMMKVSIP